MPRDKHKIYSKMIITFGASFGSPHQDPEHAYQDICIRTEELTEIIATYIKEKFKKDILNAEFSISSFQRLDDNGIVIYDYVDVEEDVSYPVYGMEGEDE